MEANPYSSIHVAPLQFKPPDAEHSGSIVRGEDASKIDSEGSVSSKSPDDQPLGAFQNYLRAVYTFTPSANLSPMTVTLSLEAGDVILVHSIHTTGWADGTLLSNGTRGWLPTNYCESYSPAPMRPLLRGLIGLWDVVRLGDTANMSLFHNQDFLRGLVAGVRSLLERLECLTRSSPFVKQHERLRRTRKALLADLSLLVKTAKKLQDLADNTDRVELADDILDVIMLRAFKVLTRSIRFLDIWNDLFQVAEVFGEEDHTALRGFSFPDGQDATMSGHQNFNPTVKSKPGQGSPDHKNPHANEDRDERLKIKPLADMSSSAVTESPPFVELIVTSPQSVQKPASHKTPSTYPSGGDSNLTLLSTQLTQSYDELLGVMALFLGSHLQSRSSLELLTTTQRAVDSCRRLQTLIGQVLTQIPDPVERLSIAGDIMCDCITSLVQAAQDVLQAPKTSEQASFKEFNGWEELLNAATTCVRAAGVCFDQASLALQEIGDLEFCARSDSPTTSFNGLNSSPFKPGNHSLDLYTTTPLSQTESENGNTDSQSQADSSARSTADLSIGRVSLSTAQLSSLNQTATEAGDNVTCAPPYRPSSILNDPIADGVQPGTDSCSDCPESKKSAARNIVVSTSSDSTYISSTSEFAASLASETLTRSTSPDESQLYSHTRKGSSLADSQATLAETPVEVESSTVKHTFADELVLKENHVIGGSLQALVEHLTSTDSILDLSFVSTFYLTFRLFTTPMEFAESLATRFELVGDTPYLAALRRLKVCDILKVWLESHWRHDCDDVALPFVAHFAIDIVTPVLPAAGQKLVELSQQWGLVSSPMIPGTVSPVRTISTSTSAHAAIEGPTPDSLITRSQLLALRSWKMGGASLGVLDLDPMELARQITLKVSSLFCSILPEELLATEWQKHSGSLAVNVHAMSTLSTDIANLVADSILQVEEAKKRAAIIKQWIKIAKRCMELSNFDTLIAIICSLNSSTIVRLKKTWDVVSQKTKSLLASLSKVVDVSRNHLALRQRLLNQSPPCLPFVGMYLTDLTFVDHGNPATRQATTKAGTVSVINFDKYTKTAKIISDLQRFQVPYRLTEIPEVQIWMQDQLIKVRATGEKSFQTHYRRSLVLEPREQQHRRTSPIETPSYQNNQSRFDFLTWTHITKEKWPITSS